MDDAPAYIGPGTPMPGRRRLLVASALEAVGGAGVIGAMCLPLARLGGLGSGRTVSTIATRRVYACIGDAALVAVGSSSASGRYFGSRCCSQRRSCAVWSPRRASTCYQALSDVHRARASGDLVADGPADDRQQFAASWRVRACHFAVSRVWLAAFAGRLAGASAGDALPVNLNVLVRLHHRRRRVASGTRVVC